MAITNTTLSSTPTTMLTVPVGSRYAVITALACNTASTTADLTLHFLLSGQTPNNQNTILKNLTIQPSDTFTFNAERIILEEGDSVVCTASANSAINVTLSYLEV